MDFHVAFIVSIIISILPYVTQFVPPSFFFFHWNMTSSHITPKIRVARLSKWKYRPLKFDNHRCILKVCPVWFLCCCCRCFGSTHDLWKFPGQGLNPRCSCNPHHSCGNTRFLTHCARPGIQPELPQRQIWILTCHRGNSYLCCIFFFILRIYLIEDVWSKVLCFKVNWDNAFFFSCGQVINLI